MKKIAITTLLLLLTVSSYAQSPLPIIYLNKDISTHFVSKLNVDYTDMSTNDVVGDNPMANIVRIKPKFVSDNLGVITIVGENFFVQFRLAYSNDPSMAHTHVDIDDPKTYINNAPVTKASTAVDSLGNRNNYRNPNYSLSHTELKRYASKLKTQNSKLNNVVAKKYKMHLKLNNIWVVDDYLFFDYTATNKANIPYTIDEIRYKISDAKKVKATNSQDRLLEPDYISNQSSFVNGKYRNIAAFKKFTFPEDKAFIIEIAEDQISGRKITLELSYSDLLSARKVQSEKDKHAANIEKDKENLTANDNNGK